MYSGIPRTTHGYYFNRQLIPGTYEFPVTTPSDTGVQPFWSHLRESSKKVAIIDALETTLQTGLPGVQLGNWSIQKQFNTIVTSSFAESATLLDDVRRIVGENSDIDVYNPTGSAKQD